jgi:hypothetical protein
MNLAEKEGILSEEDFMTLSENEVMEKLNGLLLFARNDEDCHCEAEPKQSTNIEKLRNYFRTFRTMTSIEHTDCELTNDSYFCVNLKVKQRYINPLVMVSIRPSAYSTTVDANNISRLSEVSEKARRIIDDFKTYSDTAYGCVKLV